MASYYSNVFLFFAQIASTVVFYEHNAKNYCLQNQILNYSLIKTKLHPKFKIKNVCCCTSDSEENEPHDQNNGIYSVNRVSDLYFTSSSNTPQALPIKSCLKKSGHRSNLSVTFVERVGGHPGDEEYCGSGNSKCQKFKFINLEKAVGENIQSTQDEDESDSSCSCCFSSKKKKKEIINPYLDYESNNSNVFQRQRLQEPEQQGYFSSVEQILVIPPPPSYPAPVPKTNIPHFDEAPNLKPTIKQNTPQNPQKKVLNSRIRPNSPTLIVDQDEIRLRLRTLRRTGSKLLPENSSIYSFENSPSKIPKKAVFSPNLYDCDFFGNSGSAKSIPNQSGYFTTNNKPEQEGETNESRALPPFNKQMGDY
ncbi:hypothetical protein CmeUKMEL1_17815 [Cryptosporidium meleagridis]|uniref:Integral membrane protein n=1 Tax=Cryptosporidium meleagridis TaxID=93969 RepID=A0A2P4Z621_9CRYT|nr:hypothetical protein CmeUKMEL1_17815 [Cryptosporidium meleagridis]